MKNKESTLVQDEKALDDMIDRMEKAVSEDFKNDPDFVLIGLRTRGVTLAQRLQAMIKARTRKEPPLGILDITLYRDDLSTLAKHPIVRPTTLPFDVDDKKIVLVDDVLYTGRTVRAALDQIVDFGRPALVKLAVLIDRGLREYPIQPDYTGLALETNPRQLVQVRLREIDGDEKVLLLELKG